MLFINFRVGDGEDKAAWLDAELSSVFGRDRVFRSSRSIDLGHDYEPIMWGAVESCSAMIAVIGDRWLTDYGPRLFEPDDVVRKEIAMVLAAGKPVIPVLEHSGRMHRAEELPSDLATLANCQYIRLTYRDSHAFPGLVERLIRSAPDLGIGVREGIKDLSTWNRERISLTGSKLPADLVLLGRENAVGQLRSWLVGPPGNLIVHGQTTDEVAAFAAAVLDLHDPHHRAVLVTSRAGWDHAARVPTSFPAVVISDDVPVSHAQDTRHVIIARDGFVHHPEGLVLPRIPRDKARDAFLAAGEPLHEADEHAGLARRSLRALTRRITPNAPRPPWTEAPASAIAVPLVLVSRWSTTRTADHDVVAKITGHDYAQVERFAESSAVSGDPLLHRSGSRWQLADPYDAWSQMMSQVSATDIRRFTDAAIEVLGEVDPVLSLPDPEVPFAGINGVGRIWSDELRQGLANALARLGDAGAVTVAGDAAENHAVRIVQQLLRQANDDRSGLLWRSLNDVLPLFAEAAPRAFLDNVRAGLRGEEPLLRIMFEDSEGRTLHRHSAHTGLLWALETLTWAPEHSTMATLQIARLAEVDPGGRLSNRPSASLASLLVHWPFGPIPLRRRTAIINQVRGRHPSVGWRLVNDLTDRNPFLLYPERPSVRHDWTGADHPPQHTVEVYQEEILGAVLSDLTAVPHRWADYLPRITGFPQIWRDRLIDALLSADLAALNPGELWDLWDRVNAMVSRERGADEPKGLSEDNLDRLSSFMDGIEPVADPTRHAWLFTWHPDLPGIDLTDLDAHRVAVEARRQVVIAEEFARHGVDGVARLAAASTLGETVGWTLAQVAEDSVRDEMLSRLNDPLAAGWVRRRAQDGGRDWALNTATALPDDPVSRTSFLLALPVGWAIELLELEERDVHDRFWTSVPAFPLPPERADEHLAEILARDRGADVVDALSLVLHDRDRTWQPTAELIIAAFHNLTKIPEQVTAHTTYAVGTLLTYLHANGHDLQEVAVWEMRFASMFHDRRPQALLHLIATDAAAFVDVHKVLFLPDEKVNPKALGFYMTGERLRCVPGQIGDRVDRDRLLDWVHRARGLLVEAGMLRTGDRAIGALISAGPTGEDGAWPAEAIRDVLDIDDADDVRTGFAIGLSNNNSFSTRGVYDGGRQERESAAKYLAWADVVESIWPLTAQVLRDHAEHLRAWGRRWDQKAEDDHDD